MVVRLEGGGVGAADRAGLGGHLGVAWSQGQQEVT